MVTMANRHTFYPFYSLSVLRMQRGRRWADLVDHLNMLRRTDPQVMAFSLLIRRLQREQHAHDGHRDAFCAACAVKVLEHFEGSEQELIERYWQCHDEVSQALGALRERAEEARRQRTAAA